jgi:very-short-patch-repair endonuclease
MTAEGIRWRVRSGRLFPVQRGVYRVGPVVAPRAREMAAALACGPGAVVSHRSAALLWQIGPDLGTDGPVHVTLVRVDRGHRPDIRAHRVRHLPPDDVALLEGIPVTTPRRTILDLAGELGSGELERMVAQACLRGTVDPQDLRNLAVHSAGRRGVARLRALLDADGAPALTRSEAERRFLRLVRRARLPAPGTNVTIGEMEVDFAWTNQRLVVEVDGFAFHSSRSRFENDRRRDARLAGRGYRVMRVTWRQIAHEPEALLVHLARALASE